MKRCLLGLFIAATAVVGCGDWVEPPLLGDRDAAPNPAPDAANRPVSFGMDIRRLINRTNWDPSGHGCRACHDSTFWGDKGTDSTNFDVSSLGAIRRGGVHSEGTTIIPGDPQNSVFVQKLRGQFYLGARMPKDGPPFWSEAQIQLVERWILEGAQGADNL